MINPDAVRAQVEGNILQTLSRTLYEETTFDRVARHQRRLGRAIRCCAFPTCRASTSSWSSDPNEPPLGAGEAASSPVPAALANAVFDATGVRLRSVPFNAAKLKALLA